MDKDLKLFLAALQRVKKHEQYGCVYHCFGSYDQHNESCVSQAQRHSEEFQLCLVCFKMSTVQSGDWIAEMLGQRG